MSSVLPSLICMASRCSLQTYAISCCSKHAQPGFPLRTANMCNFLLQRELDASSHIITSYVLKRNWKQANKKESYALFFVRAGRAGLKMPFLFNAYLESHSCKSGCIFSLEFIPLRLFLQIRMHFLAGIHPSQTFLANQDAFPRWKSSLQDIFSKSGSISPLEIIPHRHFLPIRMHFPAGNHPSQTFLANQDAFPRWKSSLSDISCKSG